MSGFETPRLFLRLLVGRAGADPRFLGSAISSNRITTTGHSYDAAGNLTNDTTYTYKWDAEGRLSQSYQGSTQLHQYAYNAFGQRVEDNPVQVSGYKLDSLYDPSGNKVADWFNSSSPWWWHVMVPTLGRLFEDADEWSGQGAFTLHYNALGTAISGTQETTGPAYQDSQYYPWGQFWDSSGAWPTGDFAGLYSMQCQYVPCPDQSATRDYPATLGRWMSPDALGGDITNPQSLNRYAYALNNPTSLTDPLGLQPDDCSDGFIPATDPECLPLPGCDEFEPILHAAAPWTRWRGRWGCSTSPATPSHPGASAIGLSGQRGLPQCGCLRTHSTLVSRAISFPTDRNSVRIWRVRGSNCEPLCFRRSRGLWSVRPNQPERRTLL